MKQVSHILHYNIKWLYDSDTMSILCVSFLKKYLWYFMIKDSVRVRRLLRYEFTLQGYECRTVCVTSGDLL